MTVVEDRPAFVVQLPDRPLTLDDVTELAQSDEGHRYELDEGNLIVMPPGDGEHGALITRLILWLCGHGYTSDQVLAMPGLKVTERTTGRSPDILVLRKPDFRSVWMEPSNVLLAVEVVSPGSMKVDRLVKPGEYARAGVPRFWRVERDGSPVTVHMYTRGLGEDSEPVYLGHQAVLLKELLAGEPPELG